MYRAWHAMAAFLDLRRLLLHASQGMRQGIITSGAFILFLSAGILTRPFCRFLILDGASCARACSNALFIHSQSCCDAVRHRPVRDTPGDRAQEAAGAHP